MQFKRELKEIGGSTQLIIPADLARYLELKPNDKVIIQDDKGKHGKFIAIWKEEEQNVE